MSYGLGQIPAGWLADRWGRKILLAMGILGVALAGLLVGLSWSFISLLFFLVLMGVLGGGYHPASTPMISNSVEPSKLGRSLGIHNIGGSSSFFIAPLVAAAIANFWGWRAAFIVLAVPTAIFGLIFFWLLRRQDNGQKTQQKVDARAQSSEPVSGQKTRLIVFMVFTVIAGGMAHAMAIFMPLYFTNELGLTQAIAASLPSINNSAGLWAPVAGGFLSDRFGKLPLIIITTFLGGVVIYLYGVLSWGAGFVVLLALTGIFGYLRMPVSESFILSLTPNRRRSTIFGIYYASSQPASSLLALGIGILIDNFGFKPAFNITSGIIIGITILAAFYFWKTRENKQPSPYSAS